MKTIHFISKKIMTSLKIAILDTFGYDDTTDFRTMKSDILEDIHNGFSAWYHIDRLMTSLLPESYQYDYRTICPLIQHVKRTRRVGLKGMLHDEQAIYNVDAIVILK